MWITSEVELPQGVLDAQADDRLVFFVGAGASVDAPSGLPLFGSLARQLANLARVPYDEQAPIDSFLGSMPADFDTHLHTRDLVARAGSRQNSMHEALVRLAVSSGSLRIVTTNFDDHLSAAAAGQGIEVPDTWVGPALPLGEDFVGLVHLHGSVLRHPRELVVTDRDFGRAYVTSAWATRFLLPMFKSFTVVFVGYSHDDPIMRYLALGLPSGTPRYVFTSSETATDSKWSRLGVQPVEYPVAGHDHSALVRALEAWDIRVRMGRLEHAARVGEIVAAGTTLTPVDRDYLVERLRTSDGAGEFARAASAAPDELKLDWLIWLEGLDEFKSLFTSAGASEAMSRLGSWFCSTFVSSSSLHGAALQTVQRLGQTFSANLLDLASWACDVLEAEDAAAARRWRAFLATSVHGITAPLRSDYLLPFLPEAQVRTLSVLRLALRPYLVLKRRWYVADEREGVSVPDADVTWNGEEYTLSHHLALAVRAASAGDQALGLTLEGALLSAYDLLEDYNGEGGADLLSFSRSSIAPHPQDEFREPRDAVIEGLRLYGERAQPARPNLAEHWWGFDRALFQRLGLHLVAVDANRSADQKLRWVLDRSALFAGGLKHEVYQVLKTAIPGASSDLREEVLSAVNVGGAVPDGVENREQHIDYDKYNLLVWLASLDPGWGEAAVALENLQREHADFGPREHPDFDSWMSAGSWGGNLPMDPESFAEAIRADADSALDELLSLDYSQRAFDQPEWADALTLISQVTEAHADLGEVVWTQAITRVDEAERSDLLHAVISGWGDAELGESALGAVQRIRSVLDDPGACRPVGRFLLEQIRKRIDDYSDAVLAEMRAVAAGLWRTQSRAYTHHEGIDLLSPAPLYLNSWPGDLARYWLSEVDRRWREERDTWSGLNQEEREALSALLAGPPDALDATRPALAGQLYFLFAADPGFAAEYVLPLFRDDTTAVLVWNSYLHHPRYNDKLLASGLLEATVAQWERLHDIGGDSIRGQFFGVVAGMVSFAGISADERQALLDRSVLAADGAYAKQFAETVARFLRADGVDGAEIWTRWLGAHLTARVNGLPRSASEEELECWADSVPWLGDAIPEAVHLLSREPIGFGRGFLTIAVPEPALRSYGDLLVEYMAARLNASRTSEPGLSYRIGRMIRAIQEVAGVSMGAPLITAAANIGLPIDRSA